MYIKKQWMESQNAAPGLTTLHLEPFHEDLPGQYQGRLSLGTGIVSDTSPSSPVLSSFRTAKG